MFPTGINATIVRGICKVIGTTLTKYKDPASQNLVRNLISSLMLQHPKWTLEHFNNVFKALLAKELAATPTTLKTSQGAVIALGWSLLLAANTKALIATDSADINTLIDNQANLFKIALSCANVKVSEKAVQMLNNFWKKQPNDETVLLYLVRLLQCDAATTGPILLLAQILSFKETTIESSSSSSFTVADWLRDNKPQVLDVFIKGLVTVKQKPHYNFIPSCSVILTSVTNDEFKVHLLSPLQRSMLRSPEIVLHAVGAIVKELQIDVGEFANELGKPLIQNLYSKDNTARAEAVESLKQIAMKCSNLTAIEELLKQLFAVFNGSDGKITVAEYRMNVLQGAGNLSFNTVKAEAISTLLTTTVYSFFVKAFETEIQEKVLCHALDMFSLWSRKFTGQLGNNVIDVFKRGLQMKTSTPAVRLCYLQWLLACMENAKMPQNADLAPALAKTVEKAGQNPTQIPLVAEAVCAACILMKTDNAAVDAQWNVVFDMSRQLFVSEKFIAAAPSDTLCYVMLMCKILLLEYGGKLKGSIDVLYRAITLCMNATSKKVRQYCLPLAGELVQNSTDGISIAKCLLDELTRYVQVAKITNEDVTDEQTTTTTAIPAQAFIDSIMALTRVRQPGMADSQILAASSLLCCHQPNVIAQSPLLWETVLRTIELDPKSFVSLNVSKIKTMLIEEYRPIPIYENAVATVTKVSPDIVLPIIVDRVIGQLNNADMAAVTKDEYFTFLTPEGELYDKSVIPNSEDIYKDLSSKRENKVYTYKEQLEEISLRREIEAKQRLEGKWKPPQLTAKQKEVVDKQIEKERAIKLRLTALNDALTVLISLINGARAGNPEQMALHFSRLLPAILTVLRSPLAALPLSQLYYNLQETCFRDNWSDLGQQMAIVTLRLFEPQCDLNEQWLVEKLNDQVKNVLHVFAIETIKEMDDDDIEDGVDGDSDEIVNDVVISSGVTNNNNTLTKLLSAPAFAYAFEFLKKATFFKAISGNDELLLMIVQLIGKHARTKGISATGDLTDYRHPKYLPRLEMMRLLVQIITIHKGRVQIEAVAALLDVAKASSAEPYFASADVPEIECLLNALQSHLESVRDVALRCLTICSKVLPTILAEQRNTEFNMKMTRRLWVAKHDESQANALLADELWTIVGIELPTGMCDELLKDIIHPEPSIQRSAAAALVSLLRNDANISVQVPAVLVQLIQIYNEKLTMIPARLDQFDREIEPAIDQWGPRRGVAIAICQIAPYCSLEDVDKVMQFMVAKGLGDREEIVHKEMLAAALAIVDLHGKATIAKLLPVFETFLDKAPKSSYYDNIRQAVVILVGSLARHLDKEDERIQPIVKRLLTALSTPSQQVQEAVANCLPHLMPSIKDEANAIIKKLLNQLVKSEKYGERRGAAYGIAGVVKGLGILSLKQLDIMTKLTHYIQEKKNYKSREGALFAFEMLCTTLGRLFEPYIVHVLPHLLQCFGDSSQYVRQAADDTAKVVMGKLSAHGVKLVLPSLLNALDEDSWRTKTASVELLGAMAYCAPKQLSSCLPSIVPKLIEVLGDSHTKVQEAGGDALKVIGSVIKNPEIQAIVPVLLRALEDPSANTSKCLQSLLQTKFVHFIDAPSLALIMPVVQRAFMDRSTETRKMAAQIIGNMYSLTDQKDLTPYLPNIIPGLKQSLLDPVPEVRAVSSRALGAMVSDALLFARSRLIDL